MTALKQGREKSADTSHHFLLHAHYIHSINPIKLQPHKMVKQTKQIV